jgi:hypothetical protein
MKRYLLAAVAALALGGSARADNVSIVCSGSHILVGDQSGYGVTATNIDVVKGLWYVQHTLANGTLVSRNDQYNMTNSTRRGDTSASWEGWSLRYPTKFMRGQVGRDNRGVVAYDEWLYDRGVMVMHSSSECQSGPPPINVASAPSAPGYNPQPQAPLAYAPPSPAGEDSVGLINVGKGVMVQVTLGSQPVTMIVDTGASDMLVPAKVADQLVADGEALYGPYTQVRQADGGTVSERTVTISSLRIGHHTLSNVTGSVAPDGPDAIGLLPFPVLNRVGRFTIDTTNNKLIFG